MQTTHRTGRMIRGRGWRSRLLAVGGALAILVAGFSSLSGLPAAVAAAGGGNDGRIHPTSLAQTAGRCGIPTAADRAPLSDGTAGGEWVPDMATPVADPADLTAAADIDLVVRALAACLTAGDYQTVTDLASASFLGFLAGTGGQLDPATYLLLVGDLAVTPFRIRAIDAIQVTGEAQATADVVYALANQLFHGRWTFTQVETGSDATGGAPGRRWIIDGEQPLEPDIPEGAAEIEVTLDEYEITLDPDAAAVEDLVLAVENTGDDDHEILVLRVESDGDVQDLLTEPGPALPAGLVFAGQVTVPAGAEATLPLVGLQPGAYALVSLFFNAEGVSDLAQGMQADLTISE